MDTTTPTPSPTLALTLALKAEAQRLGFDHCRILPVAHAPHADFYDAWVAADRPGEMRYLARHLDKRRDPALLADRTHGPFASLVVLGVNYHQFDLPPAVLDDPNRGIIARYAWGDDYHEIMRPLLQELDAWLAGQSGRATQHAGRNTGRGKGLVDTGPVLERDWAARAGIGFTGKNCCTINPHYGSWLFLATLLVPETLAHDPPLDFPSAHTPAAVMAGLPRADDFGSVIIPLAQGERQSATGTCGRCTRCLDKCPTDAFVGPYHLDPQRCIAYWTIETQSPIPRALRAAFGNRIFGCDICQEVCPWNQRLATRTPLLAALVAQTDRVAPRLEAGFDPATPYWLDEEAFATHFRNSPVLRATRAGMARNVAVALGNSRHPEATRLLGLLLVDAAPVVRGHAAWGLSQQMQVDGDHAHIRALLARAAQEESDAWTSEEIRLALAGE